MANTSRTEQLGRRDVAYYRQRQKNRVFSALVKFFADEAARGNISKKELANRLAKDPSQITRLFAAPSNLELDTISDILLAMGAEMDHSIVRFADRAKPNYAHPAMVQHTGLNPIAPLHSTSTTRTDDIDRASIRIYAKPSGVRVNPPTTTSG